MTRVRQSLDKRARKAPPQAASRARLSRDCRTRDKDSFIFEELYLLPGAEQEMNIELPEIYTRALHRLIKLKFDRFDEDSSETGNLNDAILPDIILPCTVEYLDSQGLNIKENIDIVFYDYSYVYLYNIPIDDNSNYTINSQGSKSQQYIVDDNDFSTHAYVRQLSSKNSRKAFWMFWANQ